VRAGKIDAISAVLLTAAPWVKPTLLGLPAGALIADAGLRRARALPTIAVAIVTTLVLAGLFQAVSGGRLLSDVMRSNAQPFSAAVWLDQVPGRLPFVVPIFGLAGHLAFRDRGTPGIAIGLGALSVSIAWTLFALAKTGSSANYWMEPCVAALVVIAHAKPGSFAFGRSTLVHASAALATALYAGVASVRDAVEHTVRYRADAAFVAQVRERCGTRPDDVVAADEAGVELATNGRILTPAYQTVYLVREGAFPAETWIADLESATVGCFVEHDGEMRRLPRLSHALDTHFVEVAAEGGFRLLAPRSRLHERPAP
jgi:hypothetical protein